jgi:hypothetical protein
LEASKTSVLAWVVVETNSVSGCVILSCAERNNARLALIAAGR